MHVFNRRPVYHQCTISVPQCILPVYVQYTLATLDLGLRSLCFCTLQQLLCVHIFHVHTKIESLLKEKESHLPQFVSVIKAVPPVAYSRLFAALNMDVFILS